MVILSKLRVGADAIVSVGTDLLITRLADEAARWLDIPVLAVNAVVLWHALRAHHVYDQPQGLGYILLEH